MDEKKELSIEEVAQKCKDAKGYVLFVGVMSDAEDKEGNKLIDFHYLRFHFALEDVKETIKQFRNQLASDMQSMVDEI